MAGDWIPLRIDLWDCPQVVRILSAMCPQNVHEGCARARTKCEIVGALYRTWALFDTYSTDGKLVGYDAESLNQVVGIEGWAENLQHVGWLVVEPQCLTMPEFERWLGHCAKRRLKDAQRKKEARAETSAKRPQNVRKKTDKKRTTEQNRTEQYKPPPPTPSGSSAARSSGNGGGGSEGSEEENGRWVTTVARLRSLGVVDAAAAIKAAREAGCAVGHVVDLLDHWIAHPDRWTLGGLHWRICTAAPDVAPSDGWPPSDDDPALARERRKVKEAVYAQCEERNIQREEWEGLAAKELRLRGL